MTNSTLIEQVSWLTMDFPFSRLFDLQWIVLIWCKWFTSFTWRFNPTFYQTTKIVKISSKNLKGCLSNFIGWTSLHSLQQDLKTKFDTYFQRLTRDSIPFPRFCILICCMAIGSCSWFCRSFAACPCCSQCFNRITQLFILIFLLNCKEVKYLQSKRERFTFRSFWRFYSELNLQCLLLTSLPTENGKMNSYTLLILNLSIDIDLQTITLNWEY